MATVKLCKRGHERTPENVYASGACKLCMKEYEQSPERSAYNHSPEHKAYLKAYQQSPEYKAYLKAYQQSPECKAYHEAYQKSPECKTYQKTYQQSQTDNLTDIYIQNSLPLGRLGDAFRAFLPTAVASCVFRLIPATIPTGNRPPFRQETGHHSGAFRPV